jgi:hypothetical protein
LPSWLRQFTQSFWERKKAYLFLLQILILSTHKRLAVSAARMQARQAVHPVLRRCRAKRGDSPLGLLVLAFKGAPVKAFHFILE